MAPLPHKRKVIFTPGDRARFIEEKMKIERPTSNVKWEKMKEHK
jgi:hypothetical protein